VSVVEILALAVGLALDAFAVSLAAGAAGHAAGPRPIFRLAFHFGLFQFMMPVLGWYAGSLVAASIAAADHWVAFGLLLWVGVRMIRSGRDPAPAPARADMSRGWTLVGLSLATSIDALAVGLSLAMLGVAIWYPSAVIGAVTCVLSLVGLRLGGRLGARFGARAEMVGGGVLILIGLRILVVHLSGD
jgi:putative Mn2+ efflux pump MntP